MRSLSQRAMATRRAIRRAVQCRDFEPNTPLVTDQGAYRFILLPEVSYWYHTRREETRQGEEKRRPLYTTRHHTTPRHATPRHATPRHTTPHCTRTHEPARARTQQRTHACAQRSTRARACKHARARASARAHARTHARHAALGRANLPV